ARTADGIGLELPSYTSRYHAGLNLQAALPSALRVEPGERVYVPCGFEIGIPDGFCGQVVSEPQVARDSAGSGGLYIIRDSHVWDVAKYVDIFINGKLRTHLGNGDFSYIVMPEGSYGITSTQFGGVYRTVVYQEDLRSLGVRIKIESGKNRYIKYDYDTNSFVILDEEDGKDMVDGGNMVEEYGNNEQ
ncbi:MAG: DUF2846 domain-containing protein, partial [Ruminobacter sp.]|nr:DUF2846 domain-containing protein [Ruminobacter sp.]